jgi:hypothetical protein
MIFTQHRWEESFTYHFVIIVKVLEDEEGRYCYKDDSVPVFNLLLEVFVFFSSSLQHRCEMKQLVAFLRIDKV